MEVQKRRFPWVLICLGAILALGALVMLQMSTRDVLQYCVTAPEPGEKGENLLALERAAVKAGSEMKDAFAWTALGGECGEVSVSSGSASATANLIAIGEGWQEVYPRFLKKGRLIGEGEIHDGATVVMLDEGLAFMLFGTDLPEDAAVKLNGATYSVAGTVRHGGSVFGGRGVGDAVAYDAYIPLTTAAKKGVAMSSLTLSALPRESAGAEVMFRQVAEQWAAGGQLVNLKKEAMRRTILPRVILLIVGMYAMIGLFKRMTNLAEGWFARFRQALRGQYFKALLPRLAGIVALTILGFGALIGATYLLLVFSAQPLYVFTEWVPDNIVEWSSLKRVFWNLTSSAAALTRVGTRELCVVEFWGGALRWGIVTALLGVALLPKRRGNREQGTGNRKSG